MLSENLKKISNLLPSIIILFIISILIVRVNLFENGYPAFGDFQYPLMNIILNKCQYIWDESGFSYHSVWQLPRWIFLYILYDILGYKLFVKLGLILAYFIPSTVAGLITYSILQEYLTFLRKDNYVKNLTILVGGLSYISAPIIIEVGGFTFLGAWHNCIMISFPIFIYVAIKRNLNFLKLFFLALIVVAFFGSPREILFYMFLSLILMIIIYIGKDKYTFLSQLKQFASFILILFALLSYLIPYIVYINHFKPWYLQSSEYGYQTVEALSSNTELVNALRQLGRWHYVVDFSTGNKILYNINYISSWVIPILCFSSLLLINKKQLRRVVASFAFLALLILFFAKGINPPFGDLYKWLAVDAPLPFGSNWMFRSPAKFFYYMAFPYAFLIATFFIYLISLATTSFKKIIVLFSVTLILVCYSWPAYTGDMKGIFHLNPLPIEYKSLEYKLSNKIDHSGNILWIPPISSGKFIWSRTKYTPDPIYLLSPRPFYSMTGWQEVIWSNMEHLVRSKDYESLYQYLKVLGIKYIALRTDNENPKLMNICSEFNSFVDHLQKNNLVKKIYDGDYIQLYEILENYSLVTINHMVITEVPEKYDNSKILKYTQNFIALLPRLDISDNVLITLPKVVNDLVIENTINMKTVVSPTRTDVSKTKWLKVSTCSNTWHSHLNRFNIENWQSDYGYGLVFTWVKNTNLTVSFKLDKSDNYKLFIRYFKNQKGGEMKVYLDGKPIEIRTKDQLNKFVWKDLGTFYLKKGEHKIVLENVKGFNAVNLFVLIPEKEYYKVQKEVERLLKNKTVIYLFEAESDLYRSDAKVIKNPKASNGELIAFGENGKAWQDLEIVKNGTYRIALRGIGEFKVKIGDKSFILKSNSLNFTYSPPFYLTKGKYKLEIIPINAKNLVKNPSFEKIFAGLPRDWNIGNPNFEICFDKGYEGKYSLKVSTSSTKKGTWSLIRSEPIDVRPGKEYLIITHMKYYNVKASHIKIEAYYPEEGKWKQLTPFIPYGKSGTSGWQEYSAIIKIPKNVTKIRIVLNAGWVLDKSKGKAITWFDDIQVIPLDEAPKLDVVWLYSSNKTIDQLFKVKEKPAKVVSYEKINPTLWKVKVNAKKPFMLSFAEAYDPLWEARIYKNGKLVEKVRSIPLYSVINGFWINETGNLTIVIRYTPQDWFELGLKISALTFIGCIGYLFYDWRREKRA